MREWLFVDDGAEAMVRGIDCAPCVEPINVGVAKGMSIADLAERIGRLSAMKGALYTIGPSLTALPTRSVDGSRGKALLGWSPQVGLDEGLRRTVRMVHRQTKEDA